MKQEQLTRDERQKLIDQFVAEKGWLVPERLEDVLLHLKLGPEKPDDHKKLIHRIKGG
jgi:hypothetical protein